MEGTTVIFVMAATAALVFLYTICRHLDHISKKADKTQFLLNKLLEKLEGKTPKV